MFVGEMQITGEDKECIINLEKSFKRELARHRPLHRYEHVVMRISTALTVPRSTVYKVLRQDRNVYSVVDGYNKDVVKQRRKCRKKVDKFDEMLIRREVHGLYKANQHVGLRGYECLKRHKRPLIYSCPFFMQIVLFICCQLDEVYMS